MGDQDIAQLTPALAYALGPGLALQGELCHAVSGKDAPSGTALAVAFVVAGP